MSTADPRYERLLRGGATLRDLDLDAFADGILAHREGLGFHQNPHQDPHGEGLTFTAARLSWTLGWNERALAERDRERGTRPG
jgi:hypothetical protein